MSLDSWTQGCGWLTMTFPLVLSLCLNNYFGHLQSLLLCLSPTLRPHAERGGWHGGPLRPQEVLCTPSLVWWCVFCTGGCVLIIFFCFLQLGHQQDHHGQGPRLCPDHHWSRWWEWPLWWPLHHLCSLWVRPCSGNHLSCVLIELCVWSQVYSLKFLFSMIMLL